MNNSFAELHLHLEGAISPETLAKLDPTITASEARARFVYQDFTGFIEAYKWLVMRLREPEHFALAAAALRRDLAAQRIEYAEVNISVGVMLWRNQDARAIIRAIQQELGGWPLIFDAVRQHGGTPAREVAELAAEFGAAFGIGGDESSYAWEDFREAIAIQPAKLFPHAGETTNAANVWEALEAGARRIGHGIRAIDDPDLCRELRDRQVPLEICISSNVATRAVATLADHPVRRLYDLGVPIVLSTDDPAMFHTTLAHEYELARNHFGFSETELEEIRQNSFQYAMAR